MRLAELLHPERVNRSLEASDKNEVLRSLAALFTVTNSNLGVGAVYEVFADREALASTGVGSGVAIPHGRIAGLGRMQAAMGIHHAGVSFDAVDGSPVYIFVAVLAPERRPSEHLKALARISRLLRNDEVRRQLLDAPDAASVIECISQQEGAE